jgi:hypothetical protein
VGIATNIVSDCMPITMYDYDVDEGAVSAFSNMTSHGIMRLSFRLSAVRMKLYVYPLNSLNISSFFWRKSNAYNFYIV